MAGLREDITGDPVRLQRGRVLCFSVIRHRQGRAVGVDADHQRALRFSGRKTDIGALDQLRRLILNGIDGKGSVRQRFRQQDRRYSVLGKRLCQIRFQQSVILCGLSAVMPDPDPVVIQLHQRVEQVDIEERRSGGHAAKQDKERRRDGRGRSDGKPFHFRRRGDLQLHFVQRVQTIPDQIRIGIILCQFFIQCTLDFRFRQDKPIRLKQSEICPIRYHDHSLLSPI